MLIPNVHVLESYPDRSRDSKYCAACDELTNHTTASHEKAAADLPEEP